MLFKFFLICALILRNTKMIALAYESFCVQNGTHHSLRRISAIFTELCHSCLILFAASLILPIRCSWLVISWALANSFILQIIIRESQIKGSMYPMVLWPNCPIHLFGAILFKKFDWCCNSALGIQNCGKSTFF